MAKYVIDSTTLTAIADSIRTKKGTTANISPQNMPSEIAGITTGENLDVVLTEQEALLEELKEVLRNKASSGGGDGEFATLDQVMDGSAVKVNLPNATKIKAYGFCAMPTLTSINMPNVVEMGQRAFQGCENLVMDTLPTNLTTIGDAAFYGCNRLAIDTLPSGVTKIPQNCFDTCSSLAITEIPAQIDFIGASAFYRCTKLASITFKGTPTTVASSAFQRCTNIKIINVPWAEGAVANAPWGATNATINYNYTGE